MIVGAFQCSIGFYCTDTLHSAGKHDSGETIFTAKHFSSAMPKSARNAQSFEPVLHPAGL